MTAKEVKKQLRSYNRIRIRIAMSCHINRILVHIDIFLSYFTLKLYRIIFCFARMLNGGFLVSIIHKIDMIESFLASP